MKLKTVAFSFLFFILSCAQILILSSCAQSNLFSELADKNSDESLLFDAKVFINQQRYDEAIDVVVNKMSASGQAKVEAREVLASGYAGKCGLNFLDYTGRLAAASSGSAFVLMSSPFVGLTVSPGDCLTSLQTLDLIGTKAQRTQSQNAFAAVVGMVLLGSATRFYTDNNPVGGDGVQDAVGISCGLSDAQIDNVILGYAYMALNFDALSASQIGSTSSTSISDSITICNSLAGSSCTDTDPALITVQKRDTMKDLLNTNTYGVGLADGSNPLLIPASCP